MLTVPQLARAGSRGRPRSDVRQFATVITKFLARDHDARQSIAFVDQQRQAELSAATVKRRVAALKVFFDFLAEETGYLSWPNPVRFERHAGRQPWRLLARSHRRRRGARLNRRISSPRDRAWFVLLWRAGLRAGELVGLRLDDVLAAPYG